MSDTAGGFTATVDWGDGTTEAGTVTGANGSFAVAVPGSTHFYVDEGSDQAVINAITRTSDSDRIKPTGPVTVTEGDSLTPHPMAIAGIQGQIFSGTVASFIDTNTNNLPSDFTAAHQLGRRDDDGRRGDAAPRRHVPGFRFTHLCGGRDRQRDGHADG